MARTKGKTRPLKTTAARKAKKTKLPVPMPEEDAVTTHKHETLDRAARAAVARITGGVSPYAVAEAWTDWALHLARSPGRQMYLGELAASHALKLARYASRGEAGSDTEDAPFAPRPHDHRFSHAGWDRPPFNVWKQCFLAADDWWDKATSGMRGLRPRDAARVNFMARQMLDTVSPSNFPGLNPEIIEETVKERGQNLIEGARHFTEDLVQTLTQSHRSAPEGFEIGKDLACTPGKVVFRNEIFELLQYTPETDNVQAEPVLVIPAWIMKYYILDLSPENSLIRYLVSQGFTVFAISWRNPGAEHAALSLEDYRKDGVMAALDVVGQIVPDRKIHANGYCLGGTMLAIAAATMARDADDRLASITLMAAQVGFVEAGELLLFLDESQVAFLEDMMWDQGYLDRPQMSRTFAAIRAEDLIYTRGVRRYFLGKRDMPSDLTVWNNDTTRMPARMHGEYLRGLFLENRLSSGRFAVEGRVIALKDITVPMFVIGTETDHIAPWRSVYKTKLFTDCDLTFVLTSSGHNGGIISKPGHPRRHYRIGHREAGALYEGPDPWLARHEPIKGSWWPAYAEWLQGKSSGLTDPPGIGAPDAGYPPIGDAPGTFIHQR